MSVWKINACCTHTICGQTPGVLEKDWGPLLTRPVLTLSALANRKGFFFPFFFSFFFCLPGGLNEMNRWVCAASESHSAEKEEKRMKKKWTSLTRRQSSTIVRSSLYARKVCVEFTSMSLASRANLMFSLGNAWWWKNESDFVLLQAELVRLNGDVFSKCNPLKGLLTSAPFYHLSALHDKHANTPLITCREQPCLQLRTL